MHRYTLVLDSYLELERDIGRGMLSSGRTSREFRQLGFAALSLRVVPDFAATPRNGEGSLSGCSVYHAMIVPGCTSTPTDMFIVNRSA